MIPYTVARIEEHRKIRKNTIAFPSGSIYKGSSILVISISYPLHNSNTRSGKHVRYYKMPYETNSFFMR